MAASTTAVAGVLSMGAGASLALSSEQEVMATTALKDHFIGELTNDPGIPEQPIRAALVVGVSYFFGALFLVYRWSSVRKMSDSRFLQRGS